nr:hypothetical protein [Pelagibacterales bacterium]
MILSCNKHFEAKIKRALEGRKIIKIKTWDGEKSTYSLKLLLDDSTILTIKSYNSTYKPLRIEVTNELDI